MEKKITFYQSFLNALFVTILLLFYFFPNKGIIKTNFHSEQYFFLMHRHNLAFGFQVQYKPHSTLTLLDKLEEEQFLDHPHGQFSFLIFFTVG